MKNLLRPMNLMLFVDFLLVNFVVLSLTHNFGLMVFVIVGIMIAHFIGWLDATEQYARKDDHDVR